MSLLSVSNHDPRCLTFSPSVLPRNLPPASSGPRGSESNTVTLRTPASTMFLHSSAPRPLAPTTSTEDVRSL